MSESQWAAAENALEEAIKAGNTDLSSTISWFPQEIVEELVEQLFVVVHSNPLDYDGCLLDWDQKIPNSRFPTFLRKFPLLHPDDRRSFPRKAFDICLDTLRGLRHTVTPEDLCAPEFSVPKWPQGNFEVSGHADSDLHLRADMTQQTAIAVDAADTEDVDDAVFWDQAKQRVFVHIADPLRYFPPGLPKQFSGTFHDHILEGAMYNVQSAYSPAKTFHMFPAEIVRRNLSMDAEDFDGSAMTFSFEFDGTAIKDGSGRVEMSRIRKPTRMTYDQVNKLVEAFRGNQDLSGNELNMARMLDSLCKVSEHLREQRRLNGATLDFGEELVVKVENSVISVTASNRDGLSSRMVEELMIFANTVAGEFAQTASVPVPYRNLRYREGLKIETFADVHVHLGVHSYCPVTSPIRRSLDLISHNQLKCAIRGETPIPAEELWDYFPDMLGYPKLHRKMERRLKQFWIHEHFRRKEEPRILNGLWNNDIFFGPFGLRAKNVPLPKNEETKPGIVRVRSRFIPISARVTRVDPVIEECEAEFHELLIGVDPSVYSDAEKFSPRF